MSANDQSSFIPDRFYDPNSSLNSLYASMDNMLSDSSDTSDYHLSSISGDIVSGVTQRIFGDNDLSAVISNNLRASGVGEERKNERAERRDNRGSFVSDIRGILGSNTIIDARAIQSGLLDLIRRGGGNLDDNSSIADSLRVGQDLMSRYKASGGAGIQERVATAMQDVGTAMSGMSGDDILSLASGLDGRGFRDMDGDGDVDENDIALAQAGRSIVNEIRLLHPLISKMHRNPNFMVRQIDRKKIKNESTGNRSNQVNLVQQGIAAYIEDVNMFSVKY